MRGLVRWLVLIGVLVVLFVAFGGFANRTAIIVFAVALVAGLIGAFFLQGRR